MEINDTLFIIPARGGSKGLPRKNILPINGKPMICYTIDAARGVTSDQNICVSTDDLEIKQVVENYGLKIPFLRPAELATDNAGTREVLLHAIDFYQNELNQQFSKICLLQPTSPLRTSQHVFEAHELWNNDLDMVVSVKASKVNPFTLNIENDVGFLEKIEKSNFTQRQELPKYWQYNGAIYFINIQSLQAEPIAEFEKVKKYVMSEESSVDVDNELDLEMVISLLMQT
jgi:CMP-N,N'-diacetyllegionaminic acid synthase